MEMLLSVLVSYFGTFSTSWPVLTMFDVRCRMCMSLVNTAIRRHVLLQRVSPLSICFVRKKQSKVSPVDVHNDKRLVKAFPNPREKVEQVLAPLMKTYGESAAPKLEFERTKYTGVWRCRLSIDWPRKFTVRSTAADPNAAELCCYLQACGMLQFLGLLDKSGNLIDHKKELFKFQDLICGSSRNSFRKMSLRLQSKREIINGRKIWSSYIDMVWPLEVHAEAVGTTQMDAENMAAALAFVKLKAKRITSGKLKDIYSVKHVALPVYCSEDTPFAYKLYVDASIKGYGAYLVANDSDAEPAKIPWYVHPWDEIQWVLDLRDSAFVEFYGVLGAVFTWKHHFKDKKVLICTDNMEVVLRIEDGLCFNLKQHQKYKKMFQTLVYTCLANRITLRAEHVPRSDNIAADYLSKQKTELFQRLMPMAKKNMKKPKVLSFLGPMKS